MAICDFDSQPIEGEVYESRTANWLERSDMVCVLQSCAEHAEDLGAHPRAWWQRWLETEGRAWGYLSLS
jgi:hypothetical protein